MTSSRVRITTIQAAVLLTFIHTLNALDAVGPIYATKGIEMAQRIRLLGPQAPSQDPRKSKARAFTAWALFNWQWCVQRTLVDTHDLSPGCSDLTRHCPSMMCYAHSEPPSLQDPPDSPLPDPCTDPDWYGQIWLRYPLDPMLYTTHFQHQFKAQCEFRIFLCDSWLQRSRVLDGKKNWDLALALPSVNLLYARMRKWYNSLPEPLTPSKIVLPSQLMLQ